MPSPLVFGAAGASGLGYIAYFASKLWPKGSLPLGVIGIPATGKTIFHEVLEFRKGGPAYETIREPTMEPQHKYKTNIHDCEKKIIGFDYPGGHEWVGQQISVVHPKWIMVFVSVDSWTMGVNWDVIGKLCEILDSDEYRAENDPVYTTKYSLLRREYIRKRKRGTGTGCQLITIVLNKIDLLRHWPRYERAKYIQQIADYFMQRHENNPFERVRRNIPIEFVATSLKFGECYPYEGLYGNSIYLIDYMNRKIEEKL